MGLRNRKTCLISGKSNQEIKTSSKRKLSKLITVAIIAGYLIYVMLIIMTRVPYIAENYTENAIPDNLEYHLIFTHDGPQKHYDVKRANKDLRAKIDVSYFPKINRLQTNLYNIQELTIDCRSMYYDECKDVFGFDPYQESSNYFKIYFIEKNHLNVIIFCDSDLELLKFLDVPKPQQVIVDKETWTDKSQYSYIENEGVAISNLTSGTHTVDIYFKNVSQKNPVAQIESSKTVLFINEPIFLNGSKSYDTNENGEIINYLWDLGDGNFISGKSEIQYAYPDPGKYGIILTVVDSDQNLGFDYLNVTVINPKGFCINGKVNNIDLKEDSKHFELDLNDFEPSFEKNDKYDWYITSENTRLYSISGENSTDDIIIIKPGLDQNGNDKVYLWLKDNLGNLTFQSLWINITPINDPPTIFGIPDITIHYEVPYEFNYLPYINDIDTPVSNLVINTSDNRYTSVSGLNVKYKYPQSMVGEIEYVIITVWDGEFESRDVVRVWITDDWVPNLIKPLPDVYLKEGEVIINYFDLDEYFMDPDKDTLYYSYGYTHVDVVINPNHTVDFYAPNDWNGEEMTTFRATDPSGALVEDIITVVVLAVNDPPKIQNVPDLVVRYGQDYKFDVSPYIYDEDNVLEEITLVTSNPQYIRISPENHLEIILNYPLKPDLPYTDTVTITVSDGLDTDFQIITVFVKANYPPVNIKNLPIINIFEDVAVHNSVNLQDYFADNDSSILYFSAINTKNVKLNIHLNSSLDVIPKANWSGEEYITIRAQDPEYAFAEAKLIIYVIPVNDPPVITEIPILAFNVSEKYVFNLRPYIFDIDNNYTQLKIQLQDSKIDYEIHGTKIVFFTTKVLTTTCTLHVSDGENDVSQKILIKVQGGSGNTPEKYLGYLIFFILMTIIMILGVTLGVVKKYYGNYIINEFFIIYRNGCLIYHQNNPDFSRDESDADIISGMFTAVQDFTRDSFANINYSDTESMSEENWHLKKLEFKNNNIILERGDLIYLAVIFSGRLGKKLELDLRKIRREIEGSYASKLLEWKGDMDQLKGINKIIDRFNFFSKQNSNQKEPANLENNYDSFNFKKKDQSHSKLLDCQEPK